MNGVLGYESALLGYTGPETTWVNHEMNGVLGHESALLGYTGPETTWANEMNSVMNHARGEGIITRPVGQQSSALPLYHRCLLFCLSAYVLITDIETAMHFILLLKMSASMSSDVLMM